jgi:S1-C subfamily serine protease
MAVKEGIGSGFLISEDGLVMTASHVVQTADTINVRFSDGQIVSANVVASEPAADVALIRLAHVPDNAVAAKAGDSDAVEVGDEIFIVGAPHGLTYTLTVGHVSARHDTYTLPGKMWLAEFFQTDAAVNEGNSGGPMFNMNGEVIGIVSHILTQSGGFEGLGFVATLKTANEYLIERKTFWGGISGIMLGEDIAEILNIPQSTGLLIQEISNESPAARIGLRGGTTPLNVGGVELIAGGDIILGVDDISLDEEGGYLKIKEYISNLPANGKVTVRILRRGQQMELTTERE